MVFSFCSLFHILTGRKKSARLIGCRPSLDTAPVKARARRLEPLRSTRAERPKLGGFELWTLEGSTTTKTKRYQISEK